MIRRLWTRLLVAISVVRGGTVGATVGATVEAVVRHVTPYSVVLVPLSLVGIAVVFGYQAVLSAGLPPDVAASVDVGLILAGCLAGSYRLLRDGVQRD